APVAAVETRFVAQEEGRSDRRPFTLGQQQANRVGHARGEPVEEACAQVGGGAMQGVGQGIAVVEKIPLGDAGRVAVEPAQAQPVCRRPTPLLADLLALVMVEAGEEGVEVRPQVQGVVAAALELASSIVLPVKLHTLTQHQPGVGQHRRVLRAGKQQ
ncbi:hypothetical protein RZS08_19615, partial [Arthrospira platensis SPKY1]|nr:hypothetical protein [Arthrospira platensis SPKY1]